MCKQIRPSIVFAIIDAEDSIASAAKIADAIECMLDSDKIDYSDVYARLDDMETELIQSLYKTRNMKGGLEI